MRCREHAIHPFGCWPRFRGHYGDDQHVGGGNEHLGFEIGYVVSRDREKVPARLSGEADQRHNAGARSERAGFAGIEDQTRVSGGMGQRGERAWGLRPVDVGGVLPSKGRGRNFANRRR